jgi:hypothetical protein
MEDAAHDEAIQAANAAAAHIVIDLSGRLFLHD